MTEPTVPVDRRDKLALGRVLGVPVANPAAGTVPGVTFVRSAPMNTHTTAPSDGVYTLPGGGRFKARAGAPLPDGATFLPDGDAPPAQAELDEAAVQARVDAAVADARTRWEAEQAQKAADEKRAAKDAEKAAEKAAKDAAKAATGPTASTAAAGPAEAS